MQQPDLGKRIAEQRRSCGMTQEELAARCGVTVRTVQRVESGSVTPRKYTLDRISEALDGGLFGETPRRLSRVREAIREWFNFKTHTMAKVTAWGALALTAGFLTVSGLQKGLARDFDPDKYKISNNFSFVGLAIPADIYKSFEGWIEHDDEIVSVCRGDTIRTRFGEMEYSLNGRVVRANQPGDLIVYHPKTWFRESRLEYRPLPIQIHPSAIGSGIVYKLPADATFRATGPVKDEPNSQEYVINGFMPVEEKMDGDRIYVDGNEYQPGDTVDLVERGLFRPGKSE